MLKQINSIQLKSSTTGHDLALLDVSGIGNTIKINSKITTIRVTGIENEIKFGSKAVYEKVLITGVRNVLKNCKDARFVHDIGIDNKVILARR